VSPAEKKVVVRELAAELGFDRVGIAPAGPVARQAYLREWLDRGRAGRMDYLHRYFELRADPRGLLEGARSVIVTALNYHQHAPPPGDATPRGRIAMYAWGDDYHRLVRQRLSELADRLRRRLDEPFETRVCVDTAPLLERELAARAGIGWIGKNTMVLHQKLGSYFVLGEILTTLDLPPDQPCTDHCGSCTRCLDACPTQAFPEPYRMDASKCISYLTIELRQAIPAEFHRALGDWIFGCDICQQVCPHTRRAPVTEAFPIRPPGPYPVLAELLAWSEAERRVALRGSAVKRARLEMLRRNAAIALANLAERQPLPGSGNQLEWESRGPGARPRPFQEPAD